MPMGAICFSGELDLNQRPLAPKASVLACCTTARCSLVQGRLRPSKERICAPTAAALRSIIPQLGVFIKSEPKSVQLWSYCVRCHRAIAIADDICEVPGSNVRIATLLRCSRLIGKATRLRRIRVRRLISFIPHE